jgi:hypothetical protein
LKLNNKNCEFLGFPELYSNFSKRFMLPKAL